MKNYYVYIMTDKDDDVYYIGVTNDLLKRVYQHRNKLTEGFTKKYNLTKLIYFEIFDDPTSAISREKQLKAWKRDWKQELILAKNPELNDLYEELL